MVEHYITMFLLKMELVKLLLRSAPSGTGIIAGGPIRATCEVAGH